MRWLEAEQGEYDLVFCDPPTFSNSARADDFDVQKEQVRLLRAAVARLAPGGVLYFSNNFRRFKLDENAVAEFARCEEISAGTIPPDSSARPHPPRVAADAGIARSPEGQPTIRTKSPRCEAIDSASVLSRAARSAAESAVLGGCAR